METINMSRLNLSSIRTNLPNENAQKPLADVKFDTIALMDPDDDYHCEYWEDIWDNLLKQETEKPVIHFQSPQLKFRGALVQQLREVTRKLGLTLGTLHTAVALLDLFMDCHILRDDRLTHVALACLSLAAKSEENLSKAPTLKTLAKVSGVQLCGKTFRQLEWMVGQHVRWRLLAPTPVTFAALLAQYVVTDSDLVTRHPKFVRRFKKDGAKLLEAYLDLTLSNVRLKSSAACAVGCACVAAARAALGLHAWPRWLAERARADVDTVAPVAHLLQRMMKVLKSRETEVEDQGYGSARTSPNITPSASPKYTSTPGSTCPNTSDRRAGTTHPYLELDDSKIGVSNVEYYLPQVEVKCHKVTTQDDYRFCRNARLIEASYGVEPNMAVKRGLDSVDIDRKRYRLTAQMSQVVL
ncbi:cyclin-J-like [Aricia agestis]|uniref:cyclin-J-like n=1 Tax=Aricia agestis TaxID=91739 RepID=UPI001C202BAE|nr:cyclin-J-like [Aricia agestis]